MFATCDKCGERFGRGVLAAPQQQNVGVLANPRFSAEEPAEIDRYAVKGAIDL